MNKQDLRVLTSKIKSQHDRWKRISNQTVEEILAYLEAELAHSSVLDCALLSALSAHKERILELEKGLEWATDNLNFDDEPWMTNAADNLSKYRKLLKEQGK